MKKSEKLELYTALLLQPILLNYLFFSLNYSGFDKATVPIFIFWVLSLFVTFGAYLQTKKESPYGFYLTLLGTVLFTLYSAVLGFFALYSGAFILLVAAIAIPLTLSLAVSIFAIWSLD